MKIIKISVEKKGAGFGFEVSGWNDYWLLASSRKLCSLSHRATTTGVVRGNSRPSPRFALKIRVPGLATTKSWFKVPGFGFRTADKLRSRYTTQ